MEGRNSKPMPWAVELLGMADVKIAKKSIARMQGQIVKIYGKDCDVDLECSKKYGEKYEKLKNILAAATTRDGVDVSTTGCNHSQEAPTRKAGDESSDAGNGASLKYATSCNQLMADGDIREDSQDVTDGSNSGKLESGTSANHYDKEATPTSTNGPRQAEAPQGQRAGENSVRRVEKVSTSPVRSSGPAKHQHGEFGNVMLTDDEFAKLCEKCPEADALITELDQYIESQGKTKKYKSHYATLLNWSRRKAQESKPKQGYKNINDINQENYEKAMREIEAMCAGEAV
jgi:hypothetical protein